MGLWQGPDIRVSINSISYKPFDELILFSVNLGGWFVLEPFITPALFQKYPGAIDEWSLSILMAADTANGGLSQLEDHYNTFIVSLVILYVDSVKFILFVDGAGHRGDRRCWSQLGQTPRAFLGHRCLGR